MTPTCGAATVQFLRLSLAAAVMFGAASCGTPPEPPPELPAPPHAYRLEQKARGTSTTFAACTDCAAPSRKTLTAPPPVVALATTEPAPVPKPVLPKTRSERALVLFDLASPRLRADSQARLNALAPLFRLANRIQITGYTDDLGSAALNTKLSDARALTVMLRIRQALGPEAGSATLSASGRPLCCYVADNGDEPRRAPNRRAEVLIELPNTEDVDLMVRGLRGYMVAAAAPDRPQAAVAAEVRP